MTAVHTVEPAGATSPTTEKVQCTWESSGKASSSNADSRCDQKLLHLWEETHFKLQSPALQENQLFQSFASVAPHPPDRVLLKDHAEPLLIHRTPKPTINDARAYTPKHSGFFGFSNSNDVQDVLFLLVVRIFLEQ